MDCKVSCFERVLHLAARLDGEKRNDARSIVSRMLEVSDEEAIEVAKEYLDLVFYKDHAREHISSRNETLLRGMVLYNGVNEGAKRILDFEVFAKVFEKTVFRPIEMQKVKERAKEQEGKKDAEYIYTPYALTYAKLSPWENEEDLNTAISIMDEPLIEYIDFLVEKHPELTKEDADILWEGIVMWNDYEGNYYEENDEMLVAMLEKTGVTKEAVEAYMAKEEEEER